MHKQAHTTKTGPGRRHVDGTTRGSVLNKSERIKGDKLADKAKRKVLGLNNGPAAQ